MNIYSISLITFLSNLPFLSVGPPSFWQSDYGKSLVLTVFVIKLSLYPLHLTPLLFFIHLSIPPAQSLLSHILHNITQIFRVTNEDFLTYFLIYLMSPYYTEN